MGRPVARFKKVGEIRARKAKIAFDGSHRDTQDLGRFLADQSTEVAVFYGLCGARMSIRQVDEGLIEFQQGLDALGGKQRNTDSSSGAFLGIVFSRGNPFAPDQEIFIMNVDGTGEMQLTSNDANDQSPAFSPGGDRIVFMSLRDGNPEIYVMDTDGSNVRRLTHHVGEDSYPAWSPDGRRIAFSREGDIHVMNADGSNVARVTNHGAYLYRPAWSPDGKRIVFAASLAVSPETATHHEIWSVNTNGSNLRNLTPKPPGVAESDWDNRWPVWSRTGKYVYFQSVRPGTVRNEGAPHPTGFEIYRMDADGGNPINLTQRAGVDATPDVK